MSILLRSVFKPSTVKHFTIHNMQGTGLPVPSNKRKHRKLKVCGVFDILLQYKYYYKYNYCDYAKRFDDERNCGINRFGCF